MLLFADENVPDSVSEFFRQRGHEVLLAREYLLPKSIDDVVAATGNALGAVLITWDKDFGKMASRRAPGWAKFRRLGRVTFSCPESRGRQRAEELIESIEFEFEQAQRRKDRRLLIEIKTDVMRILR